MALEISNFCGLETGGFDEFERTSGSPTVVEATDLTGEFYLTGDTSDFANFPIVAEGNSDQGNNRIIGFDIRTDDLTPPADVIFVQALKSNADTFLSWQITLQTDGTIRVHDSNGSQIGSDFSPGFSVDTVHLFEVYWVESNTIGEIEIFVDGVSKFSETSQDLLSVGNEPDVYRFTFTDTTSIDIDNMVSLTGASAASDRLGGGEVFGYQSSHATNQDIGDALTNGDWDEAGDTPGVEEADGTAVELNGASSTTADTDMDASNVRGQAGGPSGGSPDVSGTIKAAKFVFNLKRGNGSGTSLGYRYGNDVDGVTSSGDIEAELVSAYGVKEIVSEAAGVVPLATENFRIGLEAGTTDTGGREIHMADGWAMLLHVPSAATEAALTTVVATSAEGTIDKTNDTALSDIVGTSEVGTVGISINKSAALTTVVGTSDVGTVDKANDVDLTGVVGTSAVNNITNTPTVVLTSVVSTSAVGTVLNSTTITLTDAVSTSTVGTVEFTESGTAVLTGVVGTSSVGTVDKINNQTLTGIVGTSAVDIILNSTTITLTGVVGTSAVGNVTAPTGEEAALTTVLLTSTVGTVLNSTTITLTGVVGTSAVGNISFTESGSVGLIGVESISVVGSVINTPTVLLISVLATSAVDTLDKTNDIDLIGVVGTSSEGIVLNSTIITLTGVLATSAEGTVSFTESGTVVLTGVVSISAVDTLDKTNDVNLTGIIGTSAVGTISTDNVQDLISVVGTSEVGTVLNSTIITLTGVVGTSTVGTVITDIELTNVVGTSAVGSVLNSTTITLIGVESTSTVGTLDNINDISLTGVVATSAIDTVLNSTTITLIGVVSTSAVGTIEFIESGTVVLTGVIATSAVGSLLNSTTITLTGVVGTSAAGNISFTESGSIGLINVVGTSAVGSVLNSTTITLTGVEATSAVGTVTVSSNVTVVITGVELTSTVGTVGKINDSTVVITGIELTNVVGDIVSSSAGTRPIINPDATGFQDSEIIVVDSIQRVNEYTYISVAQFILNNRTTTTDIEPILTDKKPTVLPTVLPIIIEEIVPLEPAIIEIAMDLATYDYVSFIKSSLNSTIKTDIIDIESSILYAEAYAFLCDDKELDLNCILQIPVGDVNSYYDTISCFTGSIKSNVEVSSTDPWSKPLIVMMNEIWQNI